MQAEAAAIEQGLRERVKLLEGEQGEGVRGAHGGNP